MRKLRFRLIATVGGVIVGVVLYRIMVIYFPEQVGNFRVVMLNLWYIMPLLGLGTILVGLDRITAFFANFTTILANSQTLRGGSKEQRNRNNSEYDEKRYLRGMLEVFEKEENLFIPLIGEIESEYRIDDVPKDIDDVLADHNRFILVGDPGAGKSTTLRHLWRNQAEAYLEGKSVKLPLWVFLGRSENPKDADALISHWWSNEAYLPDRAEGRLGQKAVYLFIDGLNEMPDETMEERSQSIRKFIEANQDIPLTVTCRTYDYEDEKMQLGLPVVRVQPLDVDRIQLFILNHLEDDSLWNVIKDNEAFLQLATNPYNLNMMIQLSKPDGTLPEGLHDLNDLYRLYVEKRYKDYKSKDLVRSEWNRLKNALGKLAFRMIADHKGTEADEKWCRKLIKHNALRDGIDLGVLIINEGRVRFYHQSLQQYFALPKLTEALKSKWYNQGLFLSVGRQTLVEQIGDLQEAATPTVPILIQILLNTNEDVHLKATVNGALRKIKDKRTIEPLIDALSHEHEYVRFTAAQALGEIGNERAIEPLIHLLGVKGGGMGVLSASEALGKIGKQATEPLIRALDSKKEIVRYAAAVSLGYLGDKRVVEILIQLLEDINYGIWDDNVAKILGEIGDERAIRPLIQALKHDYTSVRKNAEKALVAIGERTIEPFINALKDEDDTIRLYAAQVLGEVRNECAIQPLVKLLNDAEENVRSSSLSALEKIATPEALETVKKYKEENN